MIRLTLSLIVAALLWTAAAPQAHAQAVCGDRAELLERLEQEFSETPQALGLSEDGALIEVMVSPSGGWTILVTYPKRPSCVVATGDGWESLLVAVPAGQPA
jgi:hypothetical protein